jgi:hypothetical protein
MSVPSHTDRGTHWLSIRRVGGELGIGQITVKANRGSVMERSKAGRAFALRPRSKV